MNSKHLLIAAALFLAPAGIAEAERNPTPPPSGIVVHLFGPNSIMSDVVPDLPGETPSHATPGQAAASGQNASSAASGDSVNTSTDPSWGAIAHQMFVVGDPNDPNKPAPGRPGERQNVPASN